MCLFFLGAFGTVYKAVHNETGQLAALKITKPEENGEAQIPDIVELYILKHCRHKNIVGLLGTWVKGPETFIALDYCGGGAVSDFFQVWEMKMTEDQIALVARGSLEGLKYMHENNFIHRFVVLHHTLFFLLLLCNIPKFTFFFIEFPFLFFYILINIEISKEPIFYFQMMVKLN